MTIHRPLITPGHQRSIPSIRYFLKDAQPQARPVDHVSRPRGAPYPPISISLRRAPGCKPALLFPPSNRRKATAVQRPAAVEPLYSLSTTIITRAYCPTLFWVLWCLLLPAILAFAAAAPSQVTAVLQYYNTLRSRLCREPILIFITFIIIHIDASVFCANTNIRASLPVLPYGRSPFATEYASDKSTQGDNRFSFFQPTPA